MHGPQRLNDPRQTGPMEEGISAPMEEDNYQISELKGLLFPAPEEGCTREEKIKYIKRLIQNDNYITDEKLDWVLQKLLEEIEHE